MIELRVTSNLEQVIGRYAKAAGDQLPFATAVALTRSASDGKRAIERAMPSVLDRPNPYTMRGFRLYPAKKALLRAEVDFRPTFGSGNNPRDYLAPQVYGGARKLKAFERSLQRVGMLPPGYQAVPGVAAKIDAYGNMAASQIVQLLSYFKAFGEQGYRANITDKRRSALARGNTKAGTRGVVYFVGRPGGGRLPLGIWQRTAFGAFGSSIKPIAIFVQRTTYKTRLDVPRIVDQLVADSFERNLIASVDLANRTRR